VSSRRRSRYSEGEVKALIEDYAAYRAAADTTPRGRRLDFLVMLADLDKALKQLPMKEWEAVLLHGLLGIPQAETAHLLQIKQQTVNKRYRQGLEDVHYWINGGDD
jgi:DNA-directed RNA polymerase specialized sigma24 family protein